jgi:thiamine transporter ThiT
MTKYQHSICIAIIGLWFCIFDFGIWSALLGGFLVGCALTLAREDGQENN